MQLIQIINLVYAGKVVGKHDALVLAGFELGKFQLEGMLLCIMMGMNGAMVTLVAQAKGADMPALCGFYLNRAILISTFMFVPLSMLMIFGGPCINTLLHNDEEGARQHAATNYMMVINLPAVYCLSMFDMLRRFLNCFEMTWVPMQITIGATCLHQLWCSILVDHLGWGVAGIELALTVTSFTLLATISFYARRVPEVYDVLTWPESTVWSGWMEYLNLAFSSAVIYGTQYLVFYILIMLLGEKDSDLEFVFIAM